MKRIFITGGHLAPAKAVITELIRRGNWEIYYVGRKYSLEGEKALALEYQEIRQFPKITYLTITTGRIQRQFLINFLQSLISVAKIFVGLSQAFVWTVLYNPDVVLSFGGHVAIPVVIWSYLFGIPILTHEQTTVYGRANRFIAGFAKKVLVSWPTSLISFPKNKAVLTGNPIRPEILQVRPKDRTDKPLIYVTGGSQGAHAINTVIEKILPKLLTKYRVIHQAGSSERFHDWQNLQKIKSESYHVYQHLDGQESAQVLADCDLLVSRSGANIITEILYLGIPSILIPLPGTFGNEQEKNAQTVAETGLAEVLLQKDLTPARLVKTIEEMLAHRKEILKNRNLARDLINPGAAKLIADQVEMV